MSLHLKKLSPRRADLHFGYSIGSDCGHSPPTTIDRHNAVARGSKTGNGGRLNFCD